MMKLQGPPKIWDGRPTLSTPHGYAPAVSSFPGATVSCMKHYVKPLLDEKPDRVIIHVGTNDSKSEEVPLKIYKNISEQQFQVL